MSAQKTDGPTGIDLFSGAGGMSVGFLNAGGVPLGGIDFDADSVDTYSLNFPEAKYSACTDMMCWRPPGDLRGVDIVMGGPPCQGFSLARGARFVDDPRNGLYREFVRSVENLRPKAFVMENVEGILNIGGGVVRDQIIDDFRAAGYAVAVKVVNMAEHGVPQSRRRAIFVGLLSGREFIWPSSTHSKTREQQGAKVLFGEDLAPVVSVNDAVGDLVLPIGNYFAHRANSQMRGPRNRDAHTQPAFTLRVRGDEFGLCEDPATSAFIPGPRPDEPQTVLPPANELQYLLRERWPAWSSGPRWKESRRATVPTLSKTRLLTLREQGRLQTFPDWFRFSGRRTSQARQIGNAVPPLFAEILFRSILEQADLP